MLVVEEICYLHMFNKKYLFFWVNLSILLTNSKSTRTHTNADTTQWNIVYI